MSDAGAGDVVESGWRGGEIGDGRGGFVGGREWWWWGGVILAGFVALHWDVLRRLGWFAWTDGDWSHAMLVPVISGYFVYQRRGRIASERWEGSGWGAALMSAALVGYGAGLWLRSDMLKGYSMVLQLLGVVAAVGGWGVARWVCFAVLYLGFAVKLDERLWGAAAWRMQLAAAWGSVGMLRAIGVDADLTSTTIELYEGTRRIGSLIVAEACSGMRLLVTFAALGTAAAYQWGRAWWSRVSLVVVTVPIAVVVNVLRVTLLGYLYRIDPGYAEGDTHLFLGMLMLMPAGLLYLGAARVIGWLEGEGEGMTNDEDRMTKEGRSTKVEGGEARGAGVTGREREGADRSEGATPPAEPGAEGRGQASSGAVGVRRGGMVFAAVFLLVAAGVVWGMAWGMGWELMKGEAPPVKPLYEMAERLGEWERVADEVMSGPMVEEMGTDRYVRRVYGRADGSAVRVLVAYRTGWADSRPRVIGRVHTAGGAGAAEIEGLELIEGGETAAFSMGRVEGGEEVRGAVVGWVYAANGRLMRDEREVERAVSELGVKRAYWAKVEVMAMEIRGGRASAVRNESVGRARVGEFLAAGWVEIKGMLPGVGEEREWE